MELSDLILLLE